MDDPPGPDDGAGGSEPGPRRGGPVRLQPHVAHRPGPPGHPPSIVLDTIVSNNVAEAPCTPLSDEQLFVWRESYERNVGLRLRMVREWLLQHSVAYHLVKRLIAFGQLPQRSADFIPIPFENSHTEFLFAPVSWWKPQLDLDLSEVAEGFERTLGKIRQARGALRARGGHACRGVNAF